MTELTGDGLRHFLQLWEYQEAEYEAQALCHYPVYGVRLYRNNNLVTETSLCWECQTYYVRVYPGLSKWYGFEAHNSDGKRLLEFCDERLPYNRKLATNAD